MRASLQRLQSSATAAHVLPLLVFSAFLAVPGWFRIENPELPWYQRAPEHWVYPIQTLLCGGLLFWMRRHYTLSPWRGLIPAILFAIIGIIFWVAPTHLYYHWIGQGHEPQPWWEWLGITKRTEGFDPGDLAAWPQWQMASLGMRFLRMVIVVPLVEELFWRGFLMRYVVAGDKPWQRVPFGTHRWLSYVIVTGMVTLIHNTEDHLAAWVWGSLTYFLAVRTKSLGACVLMHAVGNLLLGLYILKTQSWGFW